MESKEFQTYPPQEPKYVHANNGKLSLADQETSPNILGTPGIRQTLLAKDAENFIYSITDTREQIQGIYHIGFPKDQETRSFYPHNETTGITLPADIEAALNTPLTTAVVSLLKEIKLWRWSKSRSITNGQRTFVRLDDENRTNSLQDTEGFTLFCEQVATMHQQATQLAKTQQKGFPLSPFLRHIAQEAITYDAANPDVFIDTIRLHAHTAGILPMLESKEEVIKSTTAQEETSWEEAFTKLQEKVAQQQHVYLN